MASWNSRDFASRVAFRAEAHYGDRVVRCFARRPSSVHALLASAVERNASGDALVDGELRLTWRELHDRAAAIATGLRRRGIGRGDRVVLLLGNCVQFVESLFALVRLGAVFVPVSTRMAKPELAHVLAHCGAVGIIHGAELADRLPQPGEAPALKWRFAVGAGLRESEAFDALREQGPQAEPAAVGEEDVADILYTSGTTGAPKGAMQTHLNVVHGALVYRHCMQLDERDRSIICVPMSHTTGLTALIGAVTACAGCLVIMPAFDARAFLALAAAERMTHTVLVPAMYNLCLLQADFERLDLSAWRVGGYGGAPMPATTIARLAEAAPGLGLINIYGATETAAGVTLMPPELTAEHRDSVGLVAPGAEILVMGEDGREAAAGETGELWIGGPGVVKGYWDNPAATAAEFTGGFWHSGDLGSIDAEGFVRVHDRKKDMINRGGYKIYSAEVESVLSEHPGVLESAVVAKPCPVLGERVHAFVALRGPALTAAQLQSFCSEKLSDYKVPETFSLLDHPLPRNANGKVMKRLLRDELLSSSRQ